MADAAPRPDMDVDPARCRNVVSDMVNVVRAARPARPL
jgi:hypothetical protein